MLSRKERAHLRAMGRARHRAEAGMFVASGVRAVAELLASGNAARIPLAVTSPRLADMPGGASLLSSMTSLDRVEQVTDKEMSSLAPTRSHQGVSAICELPHHRLDTVDPRSTGLMLALDGIQDPGNVGTLIRSAVAFGCTHVVCLEGSADPYGPKAVRSAAGMVLRIPVLRADVEAFLAWAAAGQALVWVADAEGEPIEAGVAPRAPACLVLGGEGQGVRAQIRARAARVVRVSMPGSAESLNVAVAGSILLHALCPLPGPIPGEKDNR